LDDRRSGPLKGIVRSDNESWNSLEEALNELGETGWEIAIPVYGPVPGREHQGCRFLFYLKDKFLIILNWKRIEIKYCKL